MVLMILLVAAAITAGWITVMTAQLRYSEQYFVVTQREIARGNARALAQQYFLESVLTKPGGPGVAVELGGGSISIPANSGAPLDTFQRSAGHNHFNPGNGDGYAVSIPVTVSAGGVTWTGSYLVKSRSPVFSGTPISMHTPASLVTGAITNSQSSLLWQPSGSYSQQSASYAVPSMPSGTLLSLGGASIAPSNFPFIPITGSEAGGIPAYNGVLNVVGNGSGINSLLAMATTSAPNGVQFVDGAVETTNSGVESDGAGVVTIDLADPALGNVILTGNVSSLVFTGQANLAEQVIAENATSIVVIANQISPATDLLSVQFNESNSRRLSFAIKSPAGNATTFQFSGGAGGWRTMMTLESSPANFTLNGGTQILLGGIQTDRAVAVTNGTLAISGDGDPKLLERLVARDGWVEGYLQ